jgi:hypothetical protein
MRAVLFDTVQRRLSWQFGGGAPDRGWDKAQGEARTLVVDFCALFFIPGQPRLSNSPFVGYHNRVSLLFPIIDSTSKSLASTLSTHHVHESTLSRTPKWRNKVVSNSLRTAFSCAFEPRCVVGPVRVSWQSPIIANTRNRLSICQKSWTNPLQVPMQQYPQSPDVTGAHQQPPVYHQDPNAAHFAQQQAQQQQYAQPQQQPQQYAGSPPPQAHPQGSYMQPQPTGAHGATSLQPGMPPQQPSGTVYQAATPVASLGRGPAPADCPACGQRSMTNTAFETGNTTQ